MAAAKRKPTSRRRNNGAIIVPSIRSYQSWDPKKLRAAESSADTGYIRTAVDICDWLLGDDKVRGALDGRINAMFALANQKKLSFDASGDGRRRNRAVRALEAGEDWDAMFQESEARQVNYWAILLGLGPGFHDWQILEEHDGRDIPILRFYHPQPLRYDQQQRTWLRRTGRGEGAEEPITFGDGEWFGHTPNGTFRPWALGLWRGLGRWVLLKHYAIGDWGRLGESASRGVVEIDKEAEGGTAENRKEIANQLFELARDGQVVLPPGFKYKTIEVAASTKDLYQQQIKLADTAIAIAIRGGNLSTNVEGGSRAAAEVQERTGDLANLRADTSSWSTTTHDQSLIYWAEENFGDRKLAPWPVYATEPEEDVKLKAETMNEALDGAEKAERLGFVVNRKVFAETFGLSTFLSPGKVIRPGEKQDEEDPDEDESDDEEELDSDESEDAEDDADDDSSEGAQARARVRARAAAKGARNGQAYADRVRKRIQAHGSKALGLTVAGMLAAVAKAKSYDEAKRLIAEKYSKLAPPTRLAELTEAAMTMAQLGGHLSINEDVPELDEEPS